MEWIMMVKSYSIYNQARPILITFLNHLAPAPVIPLIAIILFGLCILFYGYLIFSWWRNKISFAILSAWTGFLIYLIHPHGLSYEQLTFIIPFFFWIVLQPQSRQISWLWFCSLVLSWLFLFLTKLNIIPAAVNDYPFVCYVIWLVWLLTQEWIINNPQKIRPKAIN
jgi:hypothetical protein